MIAASSLIHAVPASCAPQRNLRRARAAPRRHVVARYETHGGSASDAVSNEWPSNWSIASYEDLAEFYSDKIKAEKKKNAAGTLVKDVMSTRLFTTTTGTPVEKIDFGPVSGLPVMDADGNMVGMVAKQDLARGGKTVDEVMTKRVVVTKGTATVEQAAIVMLKYKVHRLPVVDNGAKVVGIVTRTDVFSAMEHDLGM